VFDLGQLTGPQSKHEDLSNAGINVKKDKAAASGYAAMHNKFAVIDQRIVITGSYNWTTNATQNNDENLIIITSRDAAAKYNVEFERIWALAVDL